MAKRNDPDQRQSLIDKHNKLALSVESVFKPLPDDHFFPDAIIQGRINHLKQVRNLEKTTMLPKPFPSSPSIKPQHVLKITKADDPNVLLVLGFAAAYSAVAFIGECCNHKMGKLKWKDKDTVILPGNLLMSSDTIEDLFEYELSKEENDFELPEPYSTHAKNILEGKPFTTSQPNTESAERPTREPREPSEPRTPRTPKSSRDGLVTLATICEEIGIEPRDARMILRKKFASKPDAGWCWPDNVANDIRKLLSKKD